ncbi:sigma-70 family RNA polymerase sigma factor [Kordiimonas pumila]|uniref:Sigma-70 family RNA polymerase sigma factor n=1 Tax=Kordiimonas pumila TaxID=2161677 RepID=A0ABV7DAR1_9PROT|nr:sigma-70 family RNA polymerase sigma factor [Kordiimonas pumila]
MKPDADDKDLTDEELVIRVQSGDREAFRTLALRHGNRFRALAFRFVSNMALAEDLVQEAFVKLWTNADQFDGSRAKFTTWFHRIVVNKCLDEKRKRQFESLPEGYDKPDTQLTADVVLEHEGVAEKINGALAELSDRQRTAMTLSYYEGLSNQEAADVMDLHIKAFESLLVRSRQKLKKILDTDKSDILSAFG